MTDPQDEKAAGLHTGDMGTGDVNIRGSNTADPQGPGSAPSPDAEGNDPRSTALATIRARAAAGNPLRLWLRDDDAVEPSPALDHLLHLTGQAGVPLTLAVIPHPWQATPTGPALAARLEAEPNVSVAVHGWSHHNHAPEGVKKQELGLHRPIPSIHEELRAGLAHLRALHGARAQPLLVPPWNRIAPELLAGLAADGFTALSTFAEEKPVPGLAVVNTQIDIIDWKAGRIGRPAREIWTELATLATSPRPFVGVLTHHLVHDATAWAVLADLLSATREAGAEWLDPATLIAAG